MIRISIIYRVYDKTWLLFRAYYNKIYGNNLKDDTKQVFASPPILYKKMLDNSLNSSINFWHFNAKLPQNKFRPLLNTNEVLNKLGVDEDISFVGWVFAKDFAKKNPKLINSFLKSSIESKELLTKNDEQWNKIKPLMKVKNTETYEALKDGYKKGIIKEFSPKNIDDLEKIYQILSKEAGDKYISKNVPFSKDIFWLIK